MHETLVGIQENLQDLVDQIKEHIADDEPLGIEPANFGFPCLTRTELTEEAESIIDLIEERGGDNLGEHVTRIQDYVRRLQHLKEKTVPHIEDNANDAVPAYMFTLQGLRKALDPVLTRDPYSEKSKKLKRLSQRLRGIESRINELDTHTAEISTMVERIEQASEAADQLPTDMESLSEARTKIAELVDKATEHQNSILQVKKNTDGFDEQLSKIKNDAESVLKRCESAYAAATSVGLAAAFSERSSALSISMWTWVGGLAAALIAGSYFGSGQLRSLAELFKNPDIPTSVIFLNLLLSVLSIGAPVWFAWLSTKQIGQRFRLAEDYAFKASISRAYEGFRREAARFDKDMEAKLLASALTRLDELPLRLVETDSYGSPWHELASSGSIKQAMQLIPDFAEQVKDLASKALDTVASTKNLPSKTSAKPQPKTANPSDEDEDDDN